MNPPDLCLWLWTDDSTLARNADRAGVNRIGLDIERVGKSQRQAGHDTWISPHHLSSLVGLRAQMQSATLFVRTNPIHAGSHAEIEHALALGAQLFMLPNFTSLNELERFVHWVAGRATVVPLVERMAATSLISDFPALGIREFHVGLNDLALELGVQQRLQLLVSPVLTNIAAAAQKYHLRFGVGGVTQPGDDSLPIRPEWVIAQLARLRAQGAMLARCWHGQAQTRPSTWIAQSVADIRHCYRQASSLSASSNITE